MLGIINIICHTVDTCDIMYGEEISWMRILKLNTFTLGNTRNPSNTF